MIPADISFGFTDRGIEKIGIDSREDLTHALFVPLIGERSDGHDFIDMAAAHGASAMLTSRPAEEYRKKYPNIIFYEVEDTRKALQEIGLYERRKFQGTVIGVTGSVGKTTTRSMIAAALGTGKKVFQTEGNANSQVGVPVTLFKMAHSDADTAVIELGMSIPGEMARIASCAEVNFAVMTNIGLAHIEQLKTQENILREKLHILDGMRDAGILFLNGEDPLLSALTLEKIHAYGISEEKNPELRFYRPENYPLKLMLKGQAMQENAAAAMSVCDELGLDLENAADALSSFAGLAGRGETFVTDSGITILDDSYNASPASMKAGLETLSEMKGKRHIAVLADMLELGEKSPEYHREIGEYVAKTGVDCVYLLGNLSKYIADGIRDAENREKAGRNTEICHFESRDELNRHLKSVLKEGDCVLFKGSNSMGLSEIVSGYRTEK